MARLRGMFNRKALLTIIMFIIFVGAVGAGIYYYRSYQRILNNPDIVTTEEVSRLQTQVGKLMQLPNETPSTATVLDKTKLKDQAFFANAENGDKILIYANAKQAILYRPSANKIINVAPVSLDNSTTSDNGATTPTIKVAVLNGTTTDGLASTAETNIKSSIANVEFTLTSQAKKTTYTSTVVVDLSGSKADQAKAIAAAVGGTVGSLPSGETAPSGTDILVIVAK